MAPLPAHLASIRCRGLLGGGAAPGLRSPGLSRLPAAKSLVPAPGSSNVASFETSQSRRRRGRVVAASSSPFSFSPSEFPASSGSTSGSTSAAAGPASSSSFVTMEDEFRSSQRMAAGLLQRYRKVVHAGYKDHLKNFASAGIAAYSLGWTEEGLRKELQVQLLSSPEDRAGPLSDAIPEASSAGQPAEDAGQSQSLRSPAPGPTGSEQQQLRQDTAGQEAADVDDVQSPNAALDGSAAPAPAAAATRQEVDECLLWLCIVFVTLRCIPQSVVRRWSTASPVSSDSLLQWKGFCSLIANAYYTQGMAWYSIQRLQMEQMAATGRAEPAVVVADRMRLVFTTLEVVDPRWGGLKDFPTL